MASRELEIHLDRNGVVHLYMQIAAGIRWQIAVGIFRPGAHLPNIRDAAAMLHVNLHTVRQAYARLEQDGLIELQQGAGSIVLPGPPDMNRRSPEKFIRSVLSTAEKEYGLSAKDLASLLTVFQSHNSTGITIAECNDSQTADFAEQLQKSWQKPVRPWNFLKQKSPPEGFIIATYFHFIELRERWPERIGDMHFVSVSMDPSLASVLLKKRKELGCTRVVVAEKERSVAQAVIEDLRKVLPVSQQNLELTIEVNKDPSKSLKSGRPNTLVLYPPRCWDLLHSRSRRNPRAVLLRYLLQQQDLRKIASDLKL